MLKFGKLLGVAIVIHNYWWFLQRKTMDFLKETGQVLDDLSQIMADGSDIAAIDQLKVPLSKPSWPNRFILHARD